MPNPSTLAAEEEEQPRHTDLYRAGYKAGHAAATRALSTRQDVDNEPDVLAVLVAQLATQNSYLGEMVEIMRRWATRTGLYQ